MAEGYRCGIGMDCQFVGGLSICRWTVNMSMDSQYVTAMNCQQNPTNTYKHPQTPTNTHKHLQTPTGATNVWLLLRSVYYPLTHSPLFPLVSPCFPLLFLQAEVDPRKRNQNPWKQSLPRNTPPPPTNSGWKPNGPRGKMPC